MWKLEKPTLQSSRNDLRKVVEQCKVLSEDDLSEFEALYEEYDNNKGFISEDYHDDFIRHYKNQSETMYQQYEKLNVKQKFDYIRADLFSVESHCPFCGFGELMTLDHYMPKSKYRELATCRLNLVPICWTCNQKKGNHNYQNFIHSYYQEFPKDVVFLKCAIDIKCGSAIAFSFYIDGSGIDSELKKRLECQIQIVDLNNRLKKECISYIFSNFFIDNISNDEDLRFFINNRLERTEERLGKNDWHAALLAGLRDCPNFNLAFLKVFFKSRNHACNV